MPTNANFTKVFGQNKPPEYSRRFFNADIVALLVLAQFLLVLLVVVLLIVVVTVLVVVLLLVVIVVAVLVVVLLVVVAVLILIIFAHAFHLHVFGMPLFCGGKQKRCVPKMVNMRKLLAGALAVKDVGAIIQATKRI